MAVIRMMKMCLDMVLLEGAYREKGIVICPRHPRKAESKSSSSRVALARHCCLRYILGMYHQVRRRVLVLVNPKSGLRSSFDSMRRAIDNAFDTAGTDLSYQFSQSAEDGIAKARRAIDKNIDIVLAVGGDGTISTIGRELIGSSIALGAIPTGSGNGFARHFGIPMSPEKAVDALASGSTMDIDVGAADDTPFLVTCSMAWEAAITESFAKSPVRGILPYVFAGMHEFFDYTPQDLEVVLDGGAPMRFKAPMICTVANLSQFGGGAKIAPNARANDDHLELVIALRQDLAKLIANIGRLFDGSLQTIPEVQSFRFKDLIVRRSRATPIQIDGELVEAGAEVHVSVESAKLKVLVP
jgi:diacylglycerol kinase (ATP)